MSTEKTTLGEISEILVNEVAQRHSFFQLKYFLIGKEPTTQAKMWQCLRELKSRKDSLEALDLEIEETKDNIELLDIQRERQMIDCLQPEVDENVKKERRIYIRQTMRKKAAAEKNLVTINEKKKWIEEECVFFLATFKNLQKVEPLKHFDDIEAQKEYWGERLSQKLNIKMLTHGQLDTEMVETIMALPDDVPVKKQSIATLNARHASMVKQLKETMQFVENKEK